MVRRFSSYDSSTDVLLVCPFNMEDPLRPERPRKERSSVIPLVPSVWDPNADERTNEVKTTKIYGMKQPPDVNKGQHLTRSVCRAGRLLALRTRILMP